MTTLNPNWPRLLVEFGATGNGVYGSNPSGAFPPYSDITARTIQQWTTRRGRQYELSQMQTGTFSCGWDNRDGAFDPTNSGSLFAPNVLPFRQVRVRAQWPPVANLLTGDQATAGEQGAWPPGTGPTKVGVHTAASATTWQIAAEADAWQGGQVFQLVTASAPTSTYLLYVLCSAAAGTDYTWTLRARCLTPGASVHVAPGIGWDNPAGLRQSLTTGTATTLTGAAGSAWSALTVSGTCPAGATCVTVSVLAASAISSAVTLEFDGLQFEDNPSGSQFVVPVWSPVFAGGVERYPQQWTLSGTFGLSTPTVTDAFGLLAQSVMSDPLTQAIYYPLGAPSTAGPNFLYTLGDSQGSTSFADSTGNRPAATIVNAKDGAGTITPGNPITSTDPGMGFAGQLSTTVTTFAPGGTVGSGATGRGSVISLPQQPTGPIGPPANAGTGWTRIVCFRPTVTPTEESAIWFAEGGPSVGNTSVSISYSSNGHTVCGLNGSTGDSFDVGSAPLGDWQMAGVSLDATATQEVVYFNGATSGVATLSGPWTPYRFTSDYLGGAAFGGNSGYPADIHALIWAFQGDIAFVAEWPYQLTGAQFSALYSAWRTAFAGDSTGQRYTRILQWAGYTGPTAIDTGMSASLGPATDLCTVVAEPLPESGGSSNSVSWVSQGLDAFTCAHNVVVTENGNHFAARDGTVTFLGRNRRYLPGAPVYTFGEDEAAGEWPYDSLATDCDPTTLANLAQITQETTQQVFTGQNNASQLNYGTWTYQATNQSNIPAEVQDSAAYIVYSHGQPHQRIASMTLHPSANPDMWPVCLSLELGLLVQVNRRPPAPAPMVSFIGFVENLAWSVTDQADAVLTVQLSPLDPTPYWALAAMHTTLAAPLTTSSTHVTLAALPDAAYNLPTASVPATIAVNGTRTPTLSYIVDPGTPQQETLTMGAGVTWTAGSGGNLYGTWTMTLATVPQHPHTAGAVFCEAYQAPTTSPAEWDANSAIGNIALAY